MDKHKYANNQKQKNENNADPDCGFRRRHPDDQRLLLDVMLQK